MPIVAAEERAACPGVRSPARPVMLRDVPGVGYMTLDGVTTQILVTSLSTLPTSWSITTTTDGAFTTTTTPALRCQHSERLALLLGQERA